MSDSSFKFLRNFHPLPSSSTVSEILNSIAYRDGVIDVVIESITLAIDKDKLPEIKRYGFLIFDETSSNLGLRLDQSGRYVEGAVSVNLETNLITSNLPLKLYFSFLFQCTQVYIYLLHSISQIQNVIGDK